MSNPEGEDHAPLLEKFTEPRPLCCAFSRTWVTIVAISVQVFLCSLMWAFVGSMIVNEIIPLPDDLARWTRESPSETNMSITVVSTVLGISVSSLLGITVQHALTLRLSRETRLSVVAAWIQLARFSLFLRPRRHLRWTLLSVIWVVVINLLTTAWSNLLTPESVVQKFARTGQELDLLNPDVSAYTEILRGLPSIYPSAKSYSLIPENISLSLSLMGDIRKAGRSAATASTDARYPSYFNAFKSSTGGVLPAIYINTRLGPKQAEAALDFQVLHKNYKGLSRTYTLVQQGYTANVSCMMLQSPTITLNNTASINRTFETPSGRRLDHDLQTWSWSTDCSTGAEYYTGEVDIVVSNHSHTRRFIATGLLATSVCFYQDFSGLSNQSFLVLIQPTSNSNYTEYFAVDERDLHTICQVTPMTTVAEVEYNENGTGNVSKMYAQARLPDQAWRLVLLPGLEIWKAYFLAQGPYSNSMADDVISINRHDILLVLEHYLRGIIEYLGSRERAVATYTLTNTGQPLPENLTVPFNGTMHVHTVGWRFHPRTHSISLAVITLVTGVTVASGAFALLRVKARLADERRRRSGPGKPVPHSTQTGIRDPLQVLGTSSIVALNPTDLMDVLVASSSGSLAGALSQCEVEEDRENLRVELMVTDGGQFVLNAC